MWSENLHVPILKCFSNVPTKSKIFLFSSLFILFRKYTYINGDKCRLLYLYNIYSILLVVGAAPGRARVQDAAATGLSTRPLRHHAGVLAQGQQSRQTPITFIHPTIATFLEDFNVQEPEIRYNFSAKIFA